MKKAAFMLPKDEDGRYILDMNIIDSSGFISPYCSSSPLISSEAASYLDNAIKNIPAKYDVALHIKSSSLLKEEENIYKKAIYNYYHNIVQQMIRDLFRNLIVSLIMFFIGVSVITIMLLVDLNEVWNTVLEILGWIFIWEAIDKFCFERHRLRQELRRAHQIKNAHIVFENKEMKL